MAVLPYSHRLRSFTAYLQQLEMESNGKSVTVSGSPVSFDTGSVIFGQSGTNGQHAFYQLLHQGTRTIPAEFIGFCAQANEMGAHQTELVAAMFGQAAALAFGRPVDPDLPAALHRQFPGDRPSVVILADDLGPRSLGELIALYEHKIFVEAAIWDTNPFDQWGVELGKDLTSTVIPALEGGDSSHLDSSTRTLVSHYLQKRGPRR